MKLHGLGVAGEDARRAVIASQRHRLPSLWLRRRAPLALGADEEV